MDAIPFDDFRRVDLRVGTITEAEPFPEAQKPSMRLRIDFGSEIGERRSAAQVTELYSIDDLVGRQVLAVVNLPPKRIGPFVSECLITGFTDADGKVVLAGPDRPVPNGVQLF